MSFEIISSIINGLVPGTFLTDVSIIRRLYTHATAYCALDTDVIVTDGYAELAALGAHSLNADVLLRWRSNDLTESVDCFRGYVRAVRAERIEHRSYLHFECISYSARLDQVRNFRVWQDRTLKDICQYLIDKNKGELEFGEGGASATGAVEIPLSIQYDETDFAYLSRMLHAWGIPMAVDDMKRKVLIGKPNIETDDDFPGTDRHWNITTMEAEIVPLQTSAQGTGSSASGEARSKCLAFNTGLNRAPGHRYEPHSDETHHAHYCQMRRHEDETNFNANAVVCRARWTGGVFDYPPGALADFADQKWLVREVSIHGHEERGASEWVAQEFTLLDKLMPLIPRQRRTPWPAHCLWARVTKNDRDDPTKSGRIQVEFDWELLESTGSDSRRCWLPTVTPYGGLKGKSGTSGFLSLPEIGEHVLVQFLDGWDSDAVVIGSVREYAAQGFAYYPHDTKRWQTPSGNQIGLTTKDDGKTDIVEIRCQDRLIFRGQIEPDKQTVVMDLTGSGDDRIHFEQGAGPAQLDIFCSGNIYMRAAQRMMIEAGQIQIKSTMGPVKIDGMPLVMLNCGPTTMQALHLDTKNTADSDAASTAHASAPGAQRAHLAESIAGDTAQLTAYKTQYQDLEPYTERFNSSEEYQSWKRRNARNANAHIVEEHPDVHKPHLTYKTPRNTDCGVFVSHVVRTQRPDFPSQGTETIRKYVHKNSQGDAPTWEYSPVNKQLPPQPGDILWKFGHVAIYGGQDAHGNYIIHQARLGDHVPETSHVPTLDFSEWFRPK